MSAAKRQEDEFGSREPSDNGSPIPNITAEEFRDHIVYIRRSLNDINTAIIGNQYGNKGILPRLDDIEAVQAEHNKKFIIWSATITAVTMIFVFFKELLTKPFKL